MLDQEHWLINAVKARDENTAILISAQGYIKPAVHTSVVQELTALKKISVCCFLIPYSLYIYIYTAFNYEYLISILKKILP